MRRRLATVGCVLAAGLSLVPLWHGLASIDAGDYLGAVLAMAMAWLLARTAVELAALIDRREER